MTFIKKKLIKYLSSKKGKHDIYIIWTFGLFTFGNKYYWKTCAFTVSRSQVTDEKPN